MRFYYVASQKDNTLIEGEIEMQNVSDVIVFLTSKGLRPVRIESAEKKLFGKTWRLFGARITMNDQIFLSKYLSLMLRLGTGLLEAVNILIADFKKPAMRSFLLRVRSNLEKGNPFYRTFEEYSSVFSKIYVNMIKAGETSGNLETTFTNLTETLIKEKKLKDQIKGALIYPILLLVTSFLILVFLVTFALPRISGVFQESGFDPPLFSKIVFAVGAFFGQFGLYIILFIVLGIIVFWYFFRYSMAFRRFLENLIGEIPGIEDLVRKIAIQRFAGTMASLIRAGMPIMDALEITADVAGQIELQSALRRISREGLAKGLTVGDAFKREMFFPQTVVNLVAISERVGKMEETLQTLADFYIGEIDTSLKRLVSYVEPFMLAFVGIIIGTIALAIIVPIYQLTSQF